MRWWRTSSASTILLLLLLFGAAAISSVGTSTSPPNVRGSERKNHRFLRSRSSSTSSTKQLTPTVNAVNGTDLALECTPARNFVRRFMAPDFENPQLVRRLDWFHDDSLVANYQQDVIFDTSQQWWVAGTRYELRRPFFELRLSPILPGDSGRYSCRLETDALFASGDSPMAFGVTVNVLVKPLSPSKPTVSQHSEFVVDLQWTHLTAPAHRPIVRYSILVQSAGEQLRVLTTDDNTTSARVDGLRPSVKYAFSVRAENIVGESGFGPESVYKIVGLPPKKPPQIVSIRNASEGGCVSVEWSTAHIGDSSIGWSHLTASDSEERPVGFRITVHRLGDGSTREWTVKGGDVRRQVLCGLDHHTDYVLAIESSNEFGHSPKTSAGFKTDQGIPSEPPEEVAVQAIPASQTIQLFWRPPKILNGIAISYQIYYRQDSQMEPPVIIKLLAHDLVKKAHSAQLFMHNISKLVPRSSYIIQLSASTSKGEGPKSEPLTALTDVAQPNPPRITSLTYNCASELMEIEWKINEDTTEPVESPLFRVSIDSKQSDSYNTTGNKLLIGQLQSQLRYSVRVSSLVASRINNRTVVEGLASRPEFLFIPKLSEEAEVCRYQSSLCPSPPANKTTKGNKMVQCDPMEAVKQNDDHQQQQQQKPISSSSTTSSSSSGAPLSVRSVVATDANASFLFLLFSVCIILAFFALFIWILRRKCTMVKSFLKSAEKRGKAVNGLEIISLVEEPSDATYGQTVTVLNFNDYFDKMAQDDNDGFRKQFMELELESPIASELSADQGGTKTPEREESDLDRENRLKNRYLNVSANVHSRIRIFSPSTLSSAVAADSDGYINANYVDSCDDKNAYIATQAPLPSTFADFWQMVWQEKSSVIVMITNLVESGKRKCDQYWPELPKSQMTVGNFQLTLEADIPNAIFVHRVIRIRLLNPPALIGQIRVPCGVERSIHHLHFTGWPDHSVPATPFPLLYFLNYAADVHSTHNQARGPCIIHCSAGVGRSGSFILIDSMRRHLLRCDRINLQAHLRHMRRQRSKLVQTLEQYIFCHTVIRHLIDNGITRQPISNFSNYINFLFNQRLPQSGQRRIQAQFKSLCSLSHQQPSKGGQQPLPSAAGGYVVLPGYHLPEEYIVCGMSLESNELWELVWKQRCQTILLLLDGGAEEEDSDDPMKIPIRLPSELLSRQQKQNGGPFVNGSGGRKSPPPRLNGGTTPLANGAERGGSSSFAAGNLMTKSVTTITSSSNSSSREESNKLSMIAQKSNANVLLRKNNNDILNVRIVRVRSRDLEDQTWLEIERIQKETLHYHRFQTMVIDQRRKSASNSNNDLSLPFKLCALQSLACQLEQERSVDVLLFLVTYQELASGCWSSQANIEFVYRKILELVLLQK